jgi:hypothetical protein
MHLISHSEKRSDEESHWSVLPCGIEAMIPFAAFGVTAGWLVTESFGTAPYLRSLERGFLRYRNPPILTFSPAREKGLLTSYQPLAFGGQVFLVPGYGFVHDLGEGRFDVDLIVSDAF